MHSLNEFSSSFTTKLRILNISKTCHINWLTKVVDMSFSTCTTGKDVHISHIILRRNWILFLSLNLLGHNTSTRKIANGKLRNRENTNLDSWCLPLNTIQKYEHNLNHVYLYSYVVIKAVKRYNVGFYIHSYFQR